MIRLRIKFGIGTCMSNQWGVCFESLIDSFFLLKVKFYIEIKLIF